jgi:subtilisin family serine protease
LEGLKICAYIRVQFYIALSKKTLILSLFKIGTLMRRFTNMLVLLACLASWTGLQAQNTHYWSDGILHPLFEDRSSVMIHFSEPVAQEAFVEALRTQPGVESADFFSIRNRAVVRFHAQQAGQAADLLSRLGLQDFPVRSIHYGLALEDDFRMWLTHNIVFKMKPGVDWFLLMPYMNGAASRFFDEAYGNIRMELDDLGKVVAVANAIEKSGLVEFCHPDFYAPITHYSDPLYPQQFQMHNTGQTIDGFAGVNDIDIDGPEAWAITTGSSSVIVAVIDDGVENHEDMNDANGVSRVIGGNTPLNGGNGAPISNGAHGQACAGIIGASHNSLGVKGAAPQSRFLTVNIFAGSETPTDIANGINWAVNNGAWVLSNSWGYTSCTVNYSVLTNAINSAASSGRGGLGCVVVFASGNGSKNCVDYPAYLESVIAVGAVTNQGVRSSYSNYGSALDVVAPSNGAAGVRTTDRMGSPGYNSGNYTNTFGGTSAACPAVAGVAALALAVNNSLTGPQVKSIIETTADDMGPSGFDVQYGYGRANAHQAVLCAQNGGSCTPPPPPPPSYCASQGNNATFEWIANFTMGAFSNSSGSAGYTDFTALTVNAAQGSAYSVSISPGFSSSTYNEYYKIWIDFNQDMDFDDPGEEVFSAGPSTTTVNGTVTIPTSALTGNTRMRVSMKYNAFQTPCEIFAYGEVEDYTINISGSAPTCDAPTGLNTTNITSSGATASWGAVTGATNYELRYRIVGGSYTQVNGIGGTSYNITGLSASTNYEWSVRTNCSNGLTSNWSANATFTTSAPPSNNYCNAGGTNANNEWIDLVQMTGFNNVTGSNGGYADFTNLTGNVTRGASTTVNFSKGSPNTNWGYWRIYVDWNQDGDFTDSGELMVSGRSRSNGTLSATFTVPSGATLGNTRMRVMMKNNAYPTSCEVYARGETEDYTLNVAASAGSGPGQSFTFVSGINGGDDLISVMPNPVRDVAFLTLDLESPIQQAYIADLTGRVLQPLSIQPGRQEFSVEGLAEGVYLVVVRTDEGVYSTRLVKVN